ncbi:MAG: LPS assembly protein LptD, partial [Gammaproteobacteria bacterium]|nr:LPS assembly protein LptD [Gammaproteobacteria bacterium]
GEEDWVLNASTIHLDRVSQRGEATNVVIDFKGVPIFYSPWLSFPLSKQRKSGFLMPGMRLSDSGDGSSGAEITVPYYFNIAPHLDATVAARVMTERGVQAQGEFRYLFDWGQGQMGAEFLPADSAFEDRPRAGFNLLHNGYFTPRLYTDVQVDWVSDKEYFEDLGTNLNLTSRTFLTQRADVTYSGENFVFFGRAQNYLTLDRSIAPGSRPYKQLPYLRVQTNFRERTFRPFFAMTTEVVNFDRENSVTGLRIDTDPTISFPMRTPGYFVVPKAKLRLTQYLLDGTGPGTGIPDSGPSRILPLLSFDSGLFFDRQLKLGSARYTQTLEPRLYYLYVPYEGQDDLPVFDSGEFTFTFAQLFRDNRFAGADRQTDANQLTLALTSRLLATASGEELLSASIGQIYYFRKRRVQLPGQQVDSGSESNLVAELTADLKDRWRLGVGVQWDPDLGKADRGTMSVRYSPDARSVINASYRYVRNTVDQTDLSAVWPLGPKWRAVGRFNYSLEQSQLLETFGGVEYQSCCWGFRTVARRYLSDIDGAYVNALFFQFELKGLGGLGGASEFLDRTIPGYQAEF